MTNMLTRNFITTMRAMRNSLSRYQESIRPTAYTVQSGKANFSHSHQKSVDNTAFYDIEGKDVWEEAVGNSQYDALYIVNECASGVSTTEDEVVVKIPIAAVKESKEVMKFEWCAPVIWRFPSGLECCYSEVVKPSWSKLVEDLELNILRGVKSKSSMFPVREGRSERSGQGEERPFIPDPRERERLGRGIKPQRSRLDSDSDDEDDDEGQSRSAYGDMRPSTRSRPEDARESRIREETSRGDGRSAQSTRGDAGRSDPRSGSRLAPPDRGDDRRSSSRSDPPSSRPAHRLEQRAQKFQEMFKEAGLGDDRSGTRSRQIDEDEQRREKDAAFLRDRDADVNRGRRNPGKSLFPARQTRQK